MADSRSRREPQDWRASSLAYDFCNVRLPQAGRVLFAGLTFLDVQMMNALVRIPSWVAAHWKASAGLAFAVGIAVACRSYLETDEIRNRRTMENRARELGRLRERILAYGRRIHERYPSGDVVLSTHDLAEQLRKAPTTVETALNLLLEEEKVQRVPLNGYWKLKV
jgi:hypothetical protein